MSAKKNKTDKKKLMTRIICLAIAGVMVLATLISALLSQVW